MMPGENQAKTAGVAPDGTAGTCQNCAVLNETLHEYMTSFLALKQKIIETDKILNEFKEKCDELQKTQRENTELHSHLDELLLNMAPFDSLHKDNVCMQEELQRTKGFLKRCRDGAADLRSRDPEAPTLKDRIIFQLKILQDSNLKQSTEVTLLQKENKALEGKLQKTQEKLDKLEKEANKEKMNTGVQTERKELCSTVVQTDVAERSSTAVQTNAIHKSSAVVQTDPTEESLMDLGKIRHLVAGLWHSVQPQSLSETPLLPGSLMCRSPLVPSLSRSIVPVSKERLHMSPVRPSPATLPRSSFRPPALRKESLLSADEILDLFRLLPPLLSPVHSPVDQRSGVDEDLQLSDEAEELHTFKEEDMKEAAAAMAASVLLLSNGLKGSGHVCSPESPPEVKFQQSSPTATQDQTAQDQTTDRKGEAVRLHISKNGKSKRSPAPTPATFEFPGKNEGCGEEKAAVDEVKESELERDEVMPSAEVCSDLIADMEWDPSPVDSLSCRNKNRLEGAHSEGAHSDGVVEPPTDPHHSSGLDVANGDGLSEAKVDNTEAEPSPLKNSPATLESVKDKEVVMMMCNGGLHEEQMSPLKPSLTDFDAKTLKPQVKDQIMEIGKRCTGVALRSESLNGVQNAHDQNHNDVVNMVSSGGDRMDMMRIIVTMNSGLRGRKQNPHNHIDDVVNSASRAELQNGQHQAPSDEIRNADVSKEACEGGGQKPSEDGCVDTESSEDLDYLGLQRKVRVAHSRKETQQSAGSINGSSEKEESKSKPSKDLPGSTDIKTPTPSPMAQGDVETRSDIMTEQNRSIDQSCSRIGDALTNGLNAPSALESQEDTQPEVEQQTPKLRQRMQDQSSRHMQRDNSCVPRIETPNRPVLTNGTSTLRPFADGAVHTNGFGASDPPLEEGGSYTRVKGLGESPRPVPMMSLAESLQSIRSMMGPPLPPLLLPLLGTPPKSVRLDHPSRPASGHVMARSTQDCSDHPAAMLSANTALRNGPQKISFSPATTTPSPCKGVPSPLQFGSATPKHAVPVPCRHPVSTLNPMSPAAAPAQENSMQMLDSMYPELSAQARTLNILRGNVSLARPVPEPSTPPQTAGSHMSSGFNSVATAFTKTQQTGKRAGNNVLLPKSAKKLRLGGSPVPVNTRPPSDLAMELPQGGRESKDPQTRNGLHIVKNETIVQVDNTESSKECIISQALTTIGSSCFDLLVVVKSHVSIKRISLVPILRDEEKEVVSDFCTKHKSLTEDFLSAILAQLKAERTTLGGDHLQSLCRVYTALCRQNKDRLKANTLAYSLLKEDFQDAAKLILFMVTSWPSLLSCGSGLCKAIHAVAHKRAEGEVLRCLTAYLHWDTNPPCGIPKLISSTLWTLRTRGEMQFQQHSRHGYDLCSASWEYIFTLDLLCAYQKWMWTHDNVIRKELWPIMNAWVTQSRSQKGPIQDVTVATVLKLIGRLGQQGIKEKYSTAVCKIATVINMFGRQAQSEGVPWEVQLAAAYAIYDLSPSNPKEALVALAEWRGEASEGVPPGITSCLTQISSLSRKVSP
ncbi:LOW QUALITY PROTEIN: little elongation complex subunit 1 [Clupea harengus]|uniref:LOW QUALITY PROTEIN: little elongation complex subunit 1 n=1 Tax=Clupea harengus TaxID=7950 RepID=A0A6P3W3G9_CLUHA|nr:LOW QUALITY PROTEIN: little elongation complex subunit 1 [Clupea harengus]